MALKTYMFSLLAVLDWSIQAISNKRHSRWCISFISSTSLRLRRPFYLKLREFLISYRFVNIIISDINTMGHDTNRFEKKEDIDPYFICVICQDVLEDPVMFYECEHLFCRKCINQSLIRKLECPTDRKARKLSDVKPALRYIKQSINKLRLHCILHCSDC